MTDHRTTFNHVGLCVADRARSRRFYEGLLGFQFWWELAPPDPGSGPDDVPEWDSLGSLKLLLALEEAFGCTIDEDVLAAARTVGDVQRVVELTRQRAAARA